MIFIEKFIEIYSFQKDFEKGFEKNFENSCIDWCIDSCTNSCTNSFEITVDISVDENSEEGFNKKFYNDVCTKFLKQSFENLGQITHSYNTSNKNTNKKLSKIYELRASLSNTLINNDLTYEIWKPYWEMIFQLPMTTEHLKTFEKANENSVILCEIIPRLIFQSIRF
jgi:hypothetical protein